jgi:hypothetical protein
MPDYDSTMLDHSAWPAEAETKRPFGGTTARVLSFGPIDTPPTLGPGKYDPRSCSGTKVRRGDFGTDRAVSDATAGAGPGAYLPTIASQPPAVALPRAPRAELWADAVVITPSPGQYDPHDKRDAIERRALLRESNPAFKDRAVRESLVNREPNPGPASYFARPPRGTGGVREFPKGPRFTPTNFVGAVPLSDNPGPATYDTAAPIELTVGHERKAAKRQSQRQETGLLAFAAPVRDRSVPLKSHLVRFGVGGYIARGPRVMVPPAKGGPGPANYQDGSACAMIRPSSNHLFDPTQQRIRKIDGI